jgi:hypothetical protein
MEQVAEQRARQFSREFEERAQALEAFATAFAITVGRELALKVEQRAQVAERCAMAFAAESANSVLAAARNVASANRPEMVAVARDGEERAQAAEAAAKAYADVGLENLAKSVAASSRVMLRRTNELAESIVSLQAQLTDHQEKLGELEKVGAALNSLILVDHSGTEAAIPARTWLRAIQSTMGDVTVTANDEIAVSRRIPR